MPDNSIGDWYEWETVSGNSYAGTIVDIDSNVLYVKCTDGVIRTVES